MQLNLMICIKLMQAMLYTSWQNALQVCLLWFPFQLMSWRMSGACTKHRCVAALQHHIQAGNLMVADPKQGFLIIASSARRTNLAAGKGCGIHDLLEL